MTGFRSLRQTRFIRHSARKSGSFLKDQKGINAIAPGIAGFDLDEMPWEEA